MPWPLQSLVQALGYAVKSWAPFSLAANTLIPAGWSVRECVSRWHDPCWKSTPGLGSGKWSNLCCPTVKLRAQPAEQTCITGSLREMPGLPVCWFCGLRQGRLKTGGTGTSSQPPSPPVSPTAGQLGSPWQDPACSQGSGRWFGFLFILALCLSLKAKYLKGQTMA